MYWLGFKFDNYNYDLVKICKKETIRSQEQDQAVDT